MSLLQRRVFLNIIQAFGLCLLIFLFFMFMWRGISSGGLLAGIAVDLPSTIILYAYLLPSLALQVLPLASAFAIYLAFSRMNGGRELIALRAGGLSLYQLLPAPLLFGLLCVALGLALSFFGQSWGLSSMRTQMLDLAESSVRLVLRPGIFNQDLPNMVFFTKAVDADSGRMSGVTIVDYSLGEEPTVISAPTGYLGTDYQRGEIYLLLGDGTMDMSGGGKMTRMSFDEYIMRFGLQSLLSGASLGPVSPAEMPWADLYGQNLENMAADNRSLALQIETERQKRIIYPLSCLVLVLALLPIACTSHGIHQKTSLLNALLVIVGYFGLLVFIEDQGLRGNLDPTLSFWLLCGIFTLLGVINLILTNNERKPVFQGLGGGDLLDRIKNKIFRKKQ